MQEFLLGVTMGSVHINQRALLMYISAKPEGNIWNTLTVPHKGNNMTNIQVSMVTKG